MAGILGRKDHTGAVADRVTSGGRQGQGVAAANERVLERVSAEDEPCAKKGGYLSGDSKVSSEVSSTPLLGEPVVWGTRPWLLRLTRKPGSLGNRETGTSVSVSSTALSRHVSLKVRFRREMVDGSRQ